MLDTFVEGDRIYDIEKRVQTPSLHNPPQLFLPCRQAIRCQDMRPYLLIGLKELLHIHCEVCMSGGETPMRASHLGRNFVVFSEYFFAQSPGATSRTPPPTTSAFASES